MIIISTCLECLSFLDISSTYTDMSLWCEQENLLPLWLCKLQLIKFLCVKAFKLIMQSESRQLNDIIIILVILIFFSGLSKNHKVRCTWNHPEKEEEIVLNDDLSSTQKSVFLTFKIIKQKDNEIEIRRRLMGE